MSATTLATPNSNTTSHQRVVRRARRGLVLAGWSSLLLGGLSGLFQARPALLNDLVSGLLGQTLTMIGVGSGQIPSWLALPVDIPPVAIALVSTAFIGLLGGIIAGLFLKGASGLLRFMVALFALLVGVVSAEIARGLLLGLSLPASLVQANDALEAIQIGLGTLGAMLGVRVGRPRIAASQPGTSRRSSRRSTRRPQTAGQTQPQQSRTPAAPPVALTRRVRQAVDSLDTPSIALPSISIPAIELPRISLRNSQNSNPRLQIGRRIQRASVRRRARANSRRVQNHHVNLGSQVTSVCPYCLEEVQPNDPRGRVVCDICGAPHHGDCWSITGKCEVPHLQN